MARGRPDPRREEALAGDAVQDGKPDEEDPDEERSAPHRSVLAGSRPSLYTGSRRR
jgi:hypothetical protein